VLTDGVECDEYGRASAPDVYAVGDVSCWYHPSLGRHLRQERATSAIEQASCVANTVLRPHALRRPRGARTARSEQYDWQVRLIGLTGPVQQHLIVDHPATASILSEPQQFTALYSEDGHSVCGAAVVNWPAAATLLRAAITDEASVDATAQALRALEVGGRLAVSG
jgi:phthalate 3,4-dioxygenase ferredoxin reductase subunit